MRIYPVRWSFSLAAVGLLAGCYNLTLAPYTGDGGGQDTGTKAGNGGGASDAAGTGGTTARGAGGAGNGDAPVATGGKGTGGTTGGNGTAGTTGTGGASGMGGTASGGGLGGGGDAGIRDAFGVQPDVPMGGTSGTGGIAGVAAFGGTTVGGGSIGATGGGGAGAMSVDAGTAGTTGASLTVNRPSVNFGSVAVGASSVASVVTVTSTAAVALSPTVTGAGFLIDSTTCGTAATSCTISVKFLPASVGAASGVLTVASGLTVSLSGTGGLTGTGGTSATGGSTGGTTGTGGATRTGGSTGTGGVTSSGGTTSANPCAGQPDFTLCNVVTTPDRHYDICVEGTCVSPGCGDATCNVPGPHFPLADTNQRLCYDNSVQLTCPASGQSFYGQDAQYGWDTLHAKSERFTRNTSTASQPVVTDNVTGLVWQGCAAGLTGNTCDSGSTAGYVWSDALAYCDGLSWGGQNDWHLPDPYELQSILDLGTNAPAIDTTAFPATPSDGFWSSSSHADAGLPGYVWDVNFSDGRAEFMVKSLYHYARCVRNGPANGTQSTRFSRDTSVADQPVVVDSVTELFWQGCAAGLTGSPCTGGTVGTYTWTNALGYCDTLNWGGHQDWRLPNAKELGSIVNERISSPAIYITVFPDRQSWYFWSSSSYTGSPSGAWRVYFNTGYGDNLDKSNGYYVRCVRGVP